MECRSGRNTSGRLDYGFLVLVLLLKEIEVVESLLHQVTSGHLLALDEVVFVGILEEQEDLLDVLGGGGPRRDLLGHVMLRLPNELSREHILVWAISLDEANKYYHKTNTY